MIYNNKKITLLIIFTFILSLGCCFAEQVNQKMEKTGAVMAQNKDVVVRATRVNTDTGFTVGFCIKVVNCSKEKNLVLLVRDNISFLFNVRLINKEGIDISPRLPNLAHRNPNRRKYRYETIPPGASYILFIPVPHQTRTKRSFSPKMNSQGHPVYSPSDLPGDLHTTPNGQYIVKIRVSFGYFIQDKDKKKIPKYPKFKHCRLTLPKNPIQIDSKLFNLDIEKVYQETKK